MKLKDLATLVDAGVIDQATADRIAQYYIDKAGPPQNKMVIVFGIFGALLVGLGTTLILAHNWDELSRSIKTIIAFIPLLAGQILCAYSLMRKSGSTVWREASSTFLVLAIGICLSLISQIYNIPGKVSSFMLTWVLLALPVIYVMRSSTASMLYLAGITFYACEVGYWTRPVSESYAYWGLLLLALPHYYMLYRQRQSSNFFVFHNWFIPLSVITVLGTVATEIVELMFVAYMSLFGLLYLLGLTPVLGDQKIRNNGYLALGSLGTVGLLLGLSFDGFWQHLRTYEFPIQNWILTPEAIAATILTLAALGLLIFQKVRQGRWMMRPVETAFLLFVIIFFIGTVSAWVTVLINILVLGIGILTIREGARQNHFGILNYGLLIVSALIMCRFFDTEISFIVRGLLFVAVGIGFFVANYQMAKRKKQNAV